MWTELDLAVIAHRSFVARQSGNSGRFAVGAEADALKVFALGAEALVTCVEALYATGGVHDALLAGVERV